MNLDDREDVKCIRREELFTQSTSTESDSPSSDEVGDASYVPDLEFVDRTNEDAKSADGSIAGDDFAFPLFKSQSVANAPSTTARELVQRIDIRSPSPTTHGPGHILEDRIRSYYFTNPAGPGLRRQLAEVTVSGDDVRIEERRHWPGTAYPWKVTIIRGDNPAQKVESTGQSNTGRKRKGKKARIAIRKRISAEETVQEQLRVEALAREATELEKRTRRNREKKVKKKARDKEKRAIATSHV
ncbi:hypothetical protein MMC25_006826 [Agyrium rufum]|nr:hypothetical protein [Agyrium rufum]